MIKFILEKVPIWFTGDLDIFDETQLSEYSKEERNKIAFKVRPISGKEDRAIREKLQKSPSGIDFKYYEGLSDSEKITFMKLDSMAVDVAEYKLSLLDAAIDQWKVVDQNEELIECTKENKMAFFDGGGADIGEALIGVISELSVKYRYYQKYVGEVSEKNLGRLPDGAGANANKLKKEGQ